jgi:hypothetical protein
MTLVGAESFRADRQTDGQIEERRDEDNSRFVEILRTRPKKKLAHKFATELASLVTMLEYSADFAIYNACCTDIWQGVHSYNEVMKIPHCEYVVRVCHSY